MALGGRQAFFYILSNLIAYFKLVIYTYLEFEIKGSENVANDELALKSFIGLMRTSSLFENLVREDVTCYDLTTNEFIVLELLYHKGKQTIQTIKERVLIASSSTTYVIDKLEEKGLVCRELSTEDRRVTFVSLTTKGQEKMATIFPFHQETIVHYFEDFTAEELADFQNMLWQISQKIKLERG